MNSKLKRIYVPMTESGFYILFCLQQPQHGYGISQQVKRMTGGELIISAGTMYGTLSKMEKDELIVFEREEEKRKKQERGGKAEQESSHGPREKKALSDY